MGRLRVLAAGLRDAGRKRLKFAALDSAGASVVANARVANLRA